MKSQIIKIYVFGTPQFIALPLEYISKTAFVDYIKDRKLFVNPDEFRTIVSGYLQYREKQLAPQKQAKRKYAFDYRTVRHG